MRESQPVGPRIRALGREVRRGRDSLTLGNCSRPVFYDGFLVPRCPEVEGNQGSAKGLTQFRQFVIHPRRNTWEQRSCDDAVRLEPLQRQGEHSLRDAADAPLNLV